MTITKPLLERLERYKFDDPSSSFPFSKRLAVENGWSIPYAQRAIQEFLRFVYLGMVAGHKVTPSDQVDQVWHLHMIYTEEYWEHFCPNVLEKPFHHGPTKGGVQEDAKYEDQYEMTKASYARIFGHAPPEDIWPPSNVRFSKHYMRVDICDHLVIKKSDFPILTRFIIWLLNFILRISRKDTI